MKRTDTLEQIGVVGVDSGQVLLCDPCYLDGQWQNEKFENKSGPTGEFSYDGCCQATLSPHGAGQLNFKAGHAGAGVACRTTYGDGCYPVFAVKNKAGQLVGLLVRFDGDEEA